MEALWPERGPVAAANEAGRPRLRRFQSPAKRRIPSGASPSASGPGSSGAIVGAITALAGGRGGALAAMGGATGRGCERVGGA